MTADAFGRSCSDFNFSQHSRVAVAVSGGSDSIGLLVLLDEYLSRMSVRPQIIAVTVDHGLRPEAAEEARSVAAFCAQRDIRHAVNRWEGEKPSSGIQAAAREVRYKLLGDAAIEMGATLVVTGHTLDDQLETVAMRLARGAGPGLAGIARATLAIRPHDEMLWFARPFLSVSRMEIRAELEARATGWIEDPSNANPDYERIAMRQSLGSAGSSRLDELSRLQETWSAKRFDLDRTVGRLLEAHVSEASPGLLLLANDLFGESDHEAASEVLRICAAFSGGSPQRMSQELALELIGKVRAAGSFRFAVSGALLDRRKCGLFLLREARAGRPIEVDQAAGESGKGTAAPLSSPPASLVRQARSSLRLQQRALNPWPSRVPLYDLRAASGLAKIAGQPAFPTPPCSL